MVHVLSHCLCELSGWQLEGARQGTVLRKVQLVIILMSFCSVLRVSLQARTPLKHERSEQLTF